MRKWMAVLAALMLAAVGAVAQAQDEGEASADEAAIRGIAGKWSEAWNGADMAAIVAMYADDADYVDIFGATHNGRAAIEAAFTATNSGPYKGTSVTIETVSVHFVKPDLAVTDSEWEVANLPESDGPAPPSKGQSTLVLAKQGDEWVIAAHRTRIPQPPTPTPSE